MICDGVREIVEDHEYPVWVSGVASMFQFFFSEFEVHNYEVALKADKERFLAYHRRLLEDGVFVPPSQFETCFVSNAHSVEDVERTLEAIEDSLRYAMKGFG